MSISLALNDGPGSTQFLDTQFFQYFFSSEFYGGSALDASVQGVVGPSFGGFNYGLDFIDENQDRWLQGDPSIYNTYKITTDFTVQVWVYLHAVPQNEDIVVQQSYNPGNFGFVWTIKFNGDAHPIFGVYTNNWGTAQIHGPALTLNTWHQLTLTWYPYGPAFLRGYVDGACVGEFKTSGGSDSLHYGPNGDFWVGGLQSQFATVPAILSMVNQIDYMFQPTDVMSAYQQFFSWDPFNPGGVGGRLLFLQLDEPVSSTNFVNTSPAGGGALFTSTGSIVAGATGIPIETSGHSVDFVDQVSARYLEGDNATYNLGYYQPAAFTAWAWVYLHAPAGPNGAVILAKNNYQPANTDVLSITIAPNSSSPVFTVNTSGGTRSSNDFNPPGDLSLNTWHMLVIAWYTEPSTSQGNLRVHIDGVNWYGMNGGALGYGTELLDYGDGSGGQWRVGSDVNASIVTFPGLIDEVNLWYTTKGAYGNYSQQVWPDLDIQREWNVGMGIPNLLSAAANIDGISVNAVFDATIASGSLTPSLWSIPGLTIGGGITQPTPGTVRLPVTGMTVLPYTLDAKTGIAGSVTGNLTYYDQFYAFTGSAPLNPIYVVIAGPTDGTHLTVIFSEVVVAEEALNPANYSIPGLTVTDVRQETLLSYVLTTTPQNPGQTYMLTASNIHDLSGNLI